MLVDVRDDLLDLLVVVAERLESERHRAVDDRHLTAAHGSLNLTSEKSGSIPVVSQSIRNEIVPVGASTVACALR